MTPLATTPAAVLRSDVLPRSWRISAVLVLAWLVSIAAAGADDGEINKRARLDDLKAILAEYHFQPVQGPARSLDVAAEPALWYTNPVRSAQAIGAVFFCQDGTLPTAVVSLSIRDNGSVFREMVLLRDTPLRVTKDSQVIWTPQQVGKPWMPLAKAPPPGPSQPLRLIQMRQLARRFEARLLKEGIDPVAIRVLPKPIHRYQDPVTGLIDGAVFAFVEATDPEALLLLEAIKSEGGGTWRYSLARMTSTPAAVTLDGREIWRTQGYWKNKRSPTDPYVEALDSKYKER